jgi:hypothetical protein
MAHSEDMPRQIILLAAPAPPTNIIVPALAPPVLSTAVAPPVVPSEASRSTSISPEYVGSWEPTANACGTPARQHNVYRATITSGLAKAGDTTCCFRGLHRTGNAWTMAADCRDHDERWTSQVRPFVDGDLLARTSGKGSSNYVRCSRRTN